jgi:hypothetical protein
MLLLNGSLLLCVLSAIPDFLIGDLKERICVKYCSTLRKTTSEKHNTKSGFAVTTQRSHSNLLRRKVRPLHARRETNQVEHQPLHVCMCVCVCVCVYMYIRHFSSGICSFQAKRLTGRFCNVWGSKSAISVAIDGSSKVGSNALPHTALSVQQFVDNKNMAVVPYTPHLHDLASSHFFFFLRMKTQLRGNSLQNAAEIREHSLTVHTKLKKANSIDTSSSSRGAGLVSWTRSTAVKEVTTITKYN